MYGFIDESGDLGFKFERGSSSSFTIGIVVFRDTVAMEEFQGSAAALRQSLRMRPSAEFHFQKDAHTRREAFLRTIQRASFTFQAVTIDKRLLQQPWKAASLYEAMCTRLLHDDDLALADVRLVLDGKRSRIFERTSAGELRRAWSSGHPGLIRRVAFKRSESDVALQLADYFTSIAHRAAMGDQRVDSYIQMASKHWRDARQLRASEL